MPNVRTPPSRHLTPEARLRAMGPRLTGDNPILPIVLDMLDAARRGERMDEATPLSRLYNQQVVGRIPQKELDRIHAALESLTPQTRAKLQPARQRGGLPRDLTAAREQLDSRIARGVLAGLMPRTRVRGPVHTFRKLETGYEFALNNKSVLHDVDPAIWRKGFDDAMLESLGIQLPTEPVLESIMPKAPAGYTPGQKLILRVSYPDVPSPTFKVILSHSDDVKIDGQSLSEDYAVLEPVVLGKASPYGTRLRVTLPENLHAASFVRVEVTSNAKKQPSNRMKILRFTVPTNAAELASPEIVAVRPGEGQLPERDVLIDARNIGQVKVLKAGNDAFGGPGIKTPTVSMGLKVRLMSAADPSQDVELPAQIVKASPLDGIGSARFTLPVDIMPGDYWLQVVSSINGIMLGAVFPNGPESNLADLKVRAHRYSLRITNVHCFDETDGFLGSEAGSDEIVAQWAGVSDVLGFSKGTSEIGGMDDNNDGQFSASDSNVFPVEGGFGETRVLLGVRVHLYENDDSDVKTWQTVMGVVGNLATSVGQLLVKLGQVKAAAIAAAVAAVSEAISAIAGLFGGMTHLGEEEIAWTAVQLQTMTNNATRSFNGTFHYHNGDKLGRYDVSYVLVRME